MKKFMIILLVLSAIVFVDYFVIALVGVFANLCQAGCEFYQNTFGILSLGIIAFSFAIAAFLYFKKSFSIS